MVRPTLQCPCDRRFDKKAFTYEAPPSGETPFDLGSQEYRREYRCCGLCGHFFSEHTMDLTGLYGGEYVEKTYGTGMAQTFQRILKLPPTQSDNAGRVASIISFMSQHGIAGSAPTLLDVGAGLGVFPFRMKEAGWDCTAIDPDPRAATHVRDVVGVKAIVGEFLLMSYEQLTHFDLVTFNKVLEHVEDPVVMLQKARDFLNPGGVVYVEVPDGEAASLEGPGREEFFVEHHHVFSAASLTMMILRAGFSILQMERLQEPSSKFTLRAFFAPIR